VFSRRPSDSLHCRLDLFRQERHRAETNTDGIEYRVRNRGRHHRSRWFAGTPRLVVRPIDQVDDHLWHLRESDDRIACPIEARHLRAIEGNLLLQRPAEGLHHIALELILDTVGVDDLAAVLHHEETLDPDIAGLAINLDVSDRTDIGPNQLVFDIRQAAP